MQERRKVRKEGEGWKVGRQACEREGGQEGGREFSADYCKEQFSLLHRCSFFLDALKIGVDYKFIKEIKYSSVLQIEYFKSNLIIEIM